MKIVYFYQYFTTPKGAYGTRVYEFSKNWVSQGHDVTIVTSVYSKSDIRVTHFLETQIHDGIKVRIINIGVDNKQSLIIRKWKFFQYMIISCWYALILPADIVIASSGPITVGLSGLVAHYLRRRKMVFEVRDLWPSVVVDLGVIKNPFFIRCSYWFEKRCYLAASHIVVLSSGMKTDIEKRYGIENITIVTNSANVPLFCTKVENPNLRGLTPYKYAIYTGNIGVINNSFWLFEAAKFLKEKGREDIKIVLVGEGQQSKELSEKKEKEKVDNFVILNSIPKLELVGLIQNSIASLVPLKGAPILDTSSPNKFFESLASGVPVIQNTNGWMKSYLSDNNVGFTLNPDKAENLSDILIELEGKPELLQEIRVRAKELAARDFDKDVLSNKMLNVFKKCILK